MQTQAARLKRADLASAVGALVLGVGLGALFGEYLGRAALAVLLVGLVLHGWGMFDKHRLERSAGAASPRWADALYWVCWAALALLIAYLIARAV